MFDFFKKKKDVGEKEKEKTENPSFLLGVQDVFGLKESEDMVVVGRLEGRVCTGDAVYLSSPGVDEDSVFLTTVKGIEINVNTPAQEAADCHVALRIENGRQYPIRKGTVLFTRERSTGDVHQAYVNALGDAFVMRQKLELSEEELETLTITDCAEIWRLFAWFQNKVAQDQSEETKQENHKKIDKLAAALCKKIMQADAVYCVFNKETGEPHMFSRTIKQEESYLCTPPDILLFTKAYEGIMKKSFSEDKFEVRRIENGEKKDGIYNFLGSTFYLNGACGVAVVSEQTAISADMLVPAPDYSNIAPQNVPVTNPDLMRWMLLLGQLKKAETEEEKLIYSLYYRFLSKEMVKARFLIPMQNEGEIPKPDENGKTVLEKGLTIKFPTMDGKYGRPAVRMFTDWKRLRMVYDESWGGMVQPISGFINTFDCAVNPTQYPKAGCYIGTELFEDMKKFEEGK